MSVLHQINNRYPSLRKSERKVAKFVRQHYSEVVLMSLHAVAKAAGTSETTVLRFCRSLGYTGYQDFKSAMIPDLLQNLQGQEAPDGDHSGSLQGRTLEQEVCRHVRSTFSNLDQQAVTAVVDKLLQAPLVLVVGLAGSAGVGQIFSDLLLSIGIKSVLLGDRVEIERMTALLGTDDVVIGISHSGETEEACLALARAGSVGAVAVALTNFSPSALADAADILLLTSVPESILGSYSCTPRIAQLTILEYIARRLLETRPSRDHVSGKEDLL